MTAVHAGAGQEKQIQSIACHAAWAFSGGSVRWAPNCPMIRRATLTTAVLLGTLTAPVSLRAETSACLDLRETRVAVASGQATSLFDVKRAVEQRYGAEMLRARLCNVDGRLAYVLTLLHRDGQVVGVSVDAANGVRELPVSLPSRTERSELATAPSRD